MCLVFSVIRTYEFYQILKKEEQLTFSLSPVQYVFHTDMGVWKLLQTGCTSVRDLNHMSYQAGE